MPTPLSSQLVCLVALVCWLAPGVGLTQPVQPAAVRGVTLQGAEYVDAASLALALGDVVSAADGILTWRGAEGVATFFAGSAEALLHRPGDGGADEWVLAAPVLADVAERAPARPASAAAGWALPLDAVQLLGVAFERGASGPVLHTPTGKSLSLEMLEPPGVASGAVPSADSGPVPGLTAGPDLGVPGHWETTEIGRAPALRFFAPPGKSLLLLDLDLAPLAYPEVTAEVDAAVAEAGSDHALLLVVSALSEQEWSSSLVFEQGSRKIEVRHPYRLRVYQGDPGTVGPGAEVAAVVLLPASFSLYQPLSVTWEGVEATVTFRR